MSMFAWYSLDNVIAFKYEDEDLKNSKKLCHPWVFEPEYPRKSRIFDEPFSNHLEKLRMTSNG